MVALAAVDAFSVAPLLNAPRRVRSTAPYAKLISRDQADFTGKDVLIQKEFGLEGHILGLSPTGREGLLLFLAAMLGRSRAVPAADVAFALLYPAYLVVANKVRFDGNQYERKFKPLLREGRGAWFKRYVFTYALVGLLLPFPVVLMAPSAVAAAATPHLFLTAVQCAVEGLTANVRFAALLRLAVPIGFNAYRLGTLRVWCESALRTARFSTGTFGSLWAWWALGLATANALLWTYNLFVFLLLRVAPQYLDQMEIVRSPEMTWRWGLLPSLAAPKQTAGDDTQVAASTAADGGSGSIG